MTVDWVEHLTTIFFDLAVPVLVAWLAYSISKWFPAEQSAHREISELVSALKIVAQSSAPPAFPPEAKK